MNPVVEAFQQFRMDGNIVPHSWYQSPRLALKSGKPNLVAITLLADIIYWYRPAEIRDETSGAHLGYRQKFGSDKLQKNYRKWGDGFGLTLRQVEDAMAFLKAAGVITVERRNIVTEAGTFPNCAFIEPVFDIIQAITYPPNEKKEEKKEDLKRSPVVTGDPSRSKGRPSPAAAGDPSRSIANHLPLQRENSKSPSETSKKTTSGEAPDGAPGVLPAALSREDKKEVKKEEEKEKAAPLPFDLLSDADRAPWIEKAEVELRENFGLAVWLKTKEKAKVSIRAQRAANLYLAAKGSGVKIGPWP